MSIVFSASRLAKSDVLDLITNATETCAPVTVVIAKDHLLITSCPSVVVQKIMEARRECGWSVSITDGGLRIDVVK